MLEKNQAEHWANQDLTGSRGDSLKVRLCPTKTGPVVRYVGIHAIINKEPPLPSCITGTAAIRDRAEQPEMCQDRVVESALPTAAERERAEQVLGPDNGLGMTIKATTVDKLAVRERVIDESGLLVESALPIIAERERAEQVPGPDNGPGMTIKATTVDKLTVRERVNKVTEQTDRNQVIELALPEMTEDQAEHCEWERAEQQVGETIVHILTERERTNNGSEPLVESALPTIAEKQAQLTEELQH